MQKSQFTVNHCIMNSWCFVKCMYSFTKKPLRLCGELYVQLYKETLEALWWTVCTALQRNSWGFVYSFTKEPLRLCGELYVQLYKETPEALCTALQRNPWGFVVNCMYSFTKKLLRLCVQLYKGTLEALWWTVCTALQRNSWGFVYSFTKELLRLCGEVHVQLYKETHDTLWWRECTVVTLALTSLHYTTIILWGHYSRHMSFSTESDRLRSTQPWARWKKCHICWMTHMNTSQIRSALRSVTSETLSCCALEHVQPIGL